MEPSALQYTIHRLLELHAPNGGASGLRAVDLASETSATFDDVEKQLEIPRQRELGPFMYREAHLSLPRLRLVAGHPRCFHVSGDFMDNRRGPPVGDQGARPTAL